LIEFFDININPKEFISSVNTVKDKWPEYEVWDKKQEDKETQRQVLHSKIKPSQDVLEFSNRQGKALLHAVDVMDEYSEAKCRDVETATEGVIGFASLPALALQIALLQKNKDLLFSSKIMSNMSTAKYWKTYFITLLPSVMMAYLTLPMYIWASGEQKKASRIARFQSRENDLKDPKVFAVYTPEQIQQARKVAASMSDVVDEDEERFKKLSSFNPIDNIKETFKTISDLSKDKKAYLNSIEQNKFKEKQRQSLFKSNIPPEEMKKAKQYQDLLTRVMRKVDMSSEEYVENSETAVGVVLGLSAFSGGILGALAYVGTSLFSNKEFKTSDLMNKSKLMASLRPSPSKLLLGGLTAFSVPLLVVLFARKALLQAAKIGRFKAKQELENDPKNFLTYSDEETARVQNVKAPEKKKLGIIAQTNEDIKFFIKLVNDYKEYENYKKTKGKEDKKMRAALKKVNLNFGQLEQAKDFQEKAFLMFEKMDEKSQAYSEDIEAFTQIAQQLPSLIFPTFAIGSYFAYKALNKVGLINQERAFNFSVKTFFKNDAEVIKKFENLSKEEKTQMISLLKDDYGSFFKLNTFIGNLNENEKVKLMGLLKGGEVNQFIKELKNKLTLMLIKTEIEYDRHKQVSFKNEKEILALLKKLPNYDENRELSALLEKMLKLNDNSKEFGREAVLKLMEKPTAFAERITNIALKLTSGLKRLHLDKVVNDEKLAKFMLKGLQSGPSIKKWLAVGGLAVLSVFLVLSFYLNFAVQSFLTRLQKKASKIGIMEAIKEMEDPRNFVDFDKVNKQPIKVKELTGSNLTIQNWLKSLGYSV